ncbi:MAG: enoyl-CoA hydratase/isomerase family protein [Candidatus Methanofastidiosia archaeon]
MELKTLKYSKEGSFFSPEKNIGVIKLNRLEALNAFNDIMLQELDTLLDKISKDSEVKVVVITADGGKAFSAGLDLKMAEKLQEAPDEDIKRLVVKGQRLYRKIENFEKPVIAAINGLALGGGLELTLACDIRIAQEEAKLGAPEVSLGLIPAWGGTQRLEKIVGLGNAKEMILTGGMITAKEAEEIGLVNKVVPLDELESTWSFTAAKIAGNAPIAVKLAKKCVNKATELTVEEGNKLEVEAALECIHTEDLKEGIQAVFEKRKGNFKGK